ncbi:transporter substrate-binding domain-containing protein [Agarivorans sp. TSD2052]|uniref:substrate-binding periplasmic protein n=1 Tax=Agarivorans sp. TSD2052 TaxID=2937286 RepID=UPI00200EF0AD|nr:transporter substrate-binding domain-containing protein [Agarivorans sp. TSD2052]UPW18986.1 transporter substrate-binding domain-containing protein [Agarivorans sp. TSD2052]
MKCFLVALLGIVLSFPSAFARGQDPLLVRHVSPESYKDYRSAYFIELLTLALDKTQAAYGNYKLTPNNVRMTQERSLQQLRENQGIDVVWTMSSAKREDDFLPIRIPLLKGLLGQRLLMIRRQDTERFAQVKTLQDLSNFSAGQGRGWPDNQILEANGLNVIKGINYDGLFGMLQRQRFDYFPRGVSEIYHELQQHREQDFVAEPNLVLSYRAPIYFFVNTNNQQLATRIEQGLWAAIDDGSFDELFSRYAYDSLVEKLKHRRVIKLDTPYLHPDTPSEQSPLWIKLH